MYLTQAPPILPTRPQPAAALARWPVMSESTPRSEALGALEVTPAVLAGPEAQALGRMAASPAAIPWRGWSRVLRRTGLVMLSDRVGLTAAGCAFYATLALFPALSMLMALYGLVFDPVTVEPQLALLRHLLPPAGWTLIDDRVRQLVAQPSATLGWQLLLSTGIALWSSASGVKALLAALNLAYEEQERRSFLRYQLVSLAITMLAIIGATVALAVLVAIPPALQYVAVGIASAWLLQVLGFLILMLSLLIGLSLLYRYGPSRKRPRWQWVTPGSVVATALWMAASALFSFYVANIASYDVSYGPLGAVAGMMMWFFVTAYAVLLGAELNSELELQTAVDSTDGPPRPLGARGAYVADHVSLD